MKSEDDKDLAIHLLADVTLELKTIDAISNHSLLPKFRESLKTIPQACDDLKEQFDKVLPLAGHKEYLDHQSKLDEPVGPIPFGDTAGYYYRIMVPGSIRVELNSEYHIAVRLIQAAQELGCDWVINAKKALEDQMNRDSVLERFGITINL